MFTSILENLATVSLYLICHNFLFIFYLKVMAWFESGIRSSARDKVRKVSIILPVRDEEKVILEKLGNIRVGLEGVAVQVEVLVGSDGSADRTAELVRGFVAEQGLAGWQVLEFGKQGKGVTINKLVEAAAGELIISTDADTLMERGTVAKIIAAFEHDGKLGCLSCVPQFRGRRMSVQQAYWDYELRLRAAEARVGRLIVVTGWLYAFKKADFEPIPSEAMADDLWIPLTILLKKKTCIQRADITALSEHTDEATEVRRRKRVISGGLDIVNRLLPRLLKDPLLFFVVFSHKINRWMLPLWCGIFAICSAVLFPRAGLVYLAVLALMGLVLGPRRFYFLLYSVFTPVLSVLHLSRQKDLSKWERTTVRDCS